MNAKQLGILAGTNPPKPEHVEFFCDEDEYRLFRECVTHEVEKDEYGSSQAVDQYLKEEGLL